MLLQVAIFCRECLDNVLTGVINAEAGRGEARL